MPLEDLQERLEKIKRVTASPFADFAEKLNSAADKVGGGLRRVAERARALHTEFNKVESELRTTDARLEAVERSIKDVNDEGKGLRRYNGLIKYGTAQTELFDTALGGVNREIGEQIDLTRKLTRQQENLNRARRRGSRIPIAGAAGGAMGGVAGGPLAFGAGIGAAATATNAVRNAFTLNQLLTTIRAEGATDTQITRAREMILEVSGGTRFTAEDVGRYMLNSMRSGFDITETTRAMSTIANLAIAEDQTLEDTGRLLSSAAQALERRLSQMAPYTEMVSRATSMSPLRPQDIEFINQRALAAFRSAGGTEIDQLAILAELRKTVSSRELLGTAMRAIPREINAVMEGRGTKRQREAWERMTMDYGVETEGKTFLEVFHQIGQVGLQDKGLIFDLFGDDAGQSIQQLITEQKLNNVLENRVKLLNAEGEVQRKVDIQRESGTNTFMRLLSSVTTAGIALVNAIGGKEMENFNSLMESAISLVERFTRFINANRDKIGEPFRRLAEWVNQNRDQFQQFFKSFLDTLTPVVGLLVGLAKRVAQLIIEYPKLAGVLAASFLTWKLLGGHISNVALGLESLWGYMRRGMPKTDTPIGFFDKILLIIRNAGDRVKSFFGMLAKSVLGLAPLLGWLKGIAAGVVGAIATAGAPVVAIIAAVAAAVIGFGALIIRNWDTVSGLFMSVARFFGAMFQYGAEVIKSWFSIIEPVIKPVLDGVNGFFLVIWDTLKEIGNWIENVFVKTLEKVQEIVDKGTQFFRKEKQAVRVESGSEFRDTQTQAREYFQSDAFQTMNRDIQDRLSKISQTDTVVSERYSQLLAKKEQIESGQTDIRTREAFQRYTADFEKFLADLKGRDVQAASAPETAMLPPTVGGDAPVFGATSPINQASNLQRIDRTSVEYVDFSSVADLETAMVGGFNTLANINSSIRDAVVAWQGSPSLNVESTELPAVEMQIQESQQVVDTSDTVQHISITINGADMSPQAIANAMIAELGRQQHANQFGH